MSNQLLLRRRASCISDKRPNYLKFTALEDGCTLALNRFGSISNDRKVEYSLNGNNFQLYTYGTVITLNTNNYVEWKRNESDESDGFSFNGGAYYYFTLNGSFTNSGMITSLLRTKTPLTKIDDMAFLNLIQESSSIVSGAGLIIPNEVTTLGASCFDRCYLSGSLYIPQGITSIPNAAFSGCGFTGELNIPNTVTAIGDGAFSGNKFSGDLEIPDSVTTIGNNAFRNCTDYNGTLTLSENLESIGSGAFYNCSNITGTVIIPNGVTSLPSTLRIYGQFNGCVKVTKFVLSNNLTTIGMGVFYNVPGVVGTFVIPASVTSISTRAMDGLYNITNYIFLPTTPPSIGSEEPFTKKPIYVPYSADHSILNAYKTAANWSTFADVIFELDENGEIPS